MSTTTFDSRRLALWYAQAHLETDPGLVQVCFLPADSPEREIRLVEVNQHLEEQTDEALEPITFGMDRGTEHWHRLSILDVTPDQWRRVERGELILPCGWSTSEVIAYPAPQSP